MNCFLWQWELQHDTTGWWEIKATFKSTVNFTFSHISPQSICLCLNKLLSTCLPFVSSLNECHSERLNDKCKWDHSLWVMMQLQQLYSLLMSSCCHEPTFISFVSLKKKESFKCVLCACRSWLKPWEVTTYMMMTWWKLWTVHRDGWCVSNSSQYIIHILKYPKYDVLLWLFTLLTLLSRCHVVHFHSLWWKLCESSLPTWWWCFWSHSYKHDCIYVYGCVWSLKDTIKLCQWGDSKRPGTSRHSDALS